jgi:WD40 repeat protein
LILQVHPSGIKSVAITSDNQYVVSGSRDKTVRVWNLINQTQKAVLKGYNCHVTTLAISSDNKYVVSGSFDYSVRV